MLLTKKMADEELQSVTDLLSSETAEVGMEVHLFKVRVIDDSIHCACKRPPYCVGRANRRPCQMLRAYWLIIAVNVRACILCLAFDAHRLAGITLLCYLPSVSPMMTTPWPGWSLANHPCLKSSLCPT